MLGLYHRFIRCLVLDNLNKMQDMEPEIKEDLERVGISNLKTLVVTSWRGKRYKFVPEIELTIDLCRRRRGAHMSRLVESISEIIEEEALIPHKSLEELERKILDRLREKHNYKRGSISMVTDLVIEKTTPITKKKTMETHKILIEVFKDDRKYKKTLQVEVLGNTLCPHAMEKSSGKSHIQRAKAILRIKTDYDRDIALEDMVDVVEKSFPSEVYTLLKIEDERYIVNKMFKNPMFVEDVTRSILKNAKNRFKNCRIWVRVTSEESIHRHNVVAEGSCIS